MNICLEVEQYLLLYEAVCNEKHSQAVTYFREFFSKKRNFPSGSPVYVPIVEHSILVQ